MKKFILFIENDQQGLFFGVRWEAGMGMMLPKMEVGSSAIRRESAVSRKNNKPDSSAGIGFVYTGLSR